jgi:hypothetical protein
LSQGYAHRAINNTGRTNDDDVYGGISTTNFILFAAAVTVSSVAIAASDTKLGEFQ